MKEFFAHIHRTWCKTQKQTIMLEELFPREIDHEYDIHKKNWHFFHGHETCYQTRLIKATNLTCKNWKCKAFGYKKIAKSVLPSFLLRMHSTSSWPLQHSFKMQSDWAFDIRPPHLLLCYNDPYALMQGFMFKEQVFCSNAYKQTLTIKNEKSENSCMNETSGHKKMYWWAQRGDQTHLTLNFGANLNLTPHSTPLYFLCT
jgi:hypothetical protein